ncbi:hypothetical protein [uncultured Winogradskyella sp.]|uniref:hypothetical protein n=1 Tax=uncultured Winogradskyella sp. TaxID=395353 RepID=UPI0026220300|nr:hypothetical protein [uncultured Winogradskyella sp.]
MAKTVKKPIVHLRVYKSNGMGNKVSYDENRKVQNENTLVKLQHNSLEWTNYLKNIRFLGYIKVDVEGAYLIDEANLEDPKTTEVKGDVLKSITVEVEQAFSGNKEVELTPEQKKIAELEAKIEALSKPKKSTNKPKTTAPEKK